MAQLLSFLTMYTVCFRTFGCKLNQAETAGMVRDFEDHGYRVVSADEGGDVFVLNTCTVTGRSEAKCRRAIRHALRSNPEATVIVVGCYSQVAAETIRSIPGVDYVLGVHEKFRVFDYFSDPGKVVRPVCHAASVEKLDEAVSRVGKYLERTRAFLKIQDGCSRRCAYCIVPFVRGPARSVPLSDVLRQAETLVREGYKEIVLTGVHVGDYGKQKGEGSLLPGLLRALLKVEGVVRLRLSSLNVEDVTNELLEILVGSERICRHLHIPLQSGCDAVLARMDRTYTTEAFREKVEWIFERLGDVGLGTDVIVGFPGETDDGFEKTVGLIQALPFSYLHVFPFSPRRGTKAASMPDRVEPRVRVERARRLIDLGRVKKRAFMRKHVGRVVDVLLEDRNRDGWMEGFSSDYLRVEVPYEGTLRNQIAPVKVGEVRDSSVRGRVVEQRV